MMVVYDSGNDIACYNVQGYHSASYSHVVYVYSYLSAGWFRWYGPTGNFCSLTLGQGVNFSASRNVGITQVDPGASHSGSVCS